MRRLRPLRRLLGWACLALVGCGRPPPASRLPSSEAALERLRATFACANGAQARAKLDRYGPEGRTKGEVGVFAVNPDRVRFDVSSPFGGALYTLTSNGARFRMLDAKQKQFLFGPPSACNLARLTGVPLPPHALVSLLRGEAPVIVHAPSTEPPVWKSAGYYEVDLRGPAEARQTLHLGVHPEDHDKPWSEQRLRTERVTVSQRGVELYRADFWAHAPAHTALPRVDEEGLDPPVPPSGPSCEAEAPRSLRLRIPSSEQDLSLHYEDFHWNPPLLPGTFSQPLPGGVEALYVDCDATAR